MNVNQIRNIRMKMALSKEYRDNMIYMLSSPHGSTYDSKIIMPENFNIFKLDQYIYELEWKLGDEFIICTIPAGIYSPQEINEISQIINS